MSTAMCVAIRCRLTTSLYRIWNVVYPCDSTDLSYMSEMHLGMFSKVATVERSVGSIIAGSCRKGEYHIECRATKSILTF